MARTSQRSEPLRGALAVGAHPVKLAVDQYADLGLQWVVGAAAVGASATIAIYASSLAADDDRLSDLDPSSNPYWSLTPVVFSAAPGAVAASDFLPIADNAGATLLVLVTVAGADYTEFAVLVHGVSRGT